MQAILDSGKPSRRLYRATHETFEDYCRQRWGFSDRRANHYIDASRRYDALKIGNKFPVLPSRERHVAALSRCESDEQAAEVWQAVVEDSPESQGPTSPLLAARRSGRLILRVGSADARESLQMAAGRRT